MAKPGGLWAALHASLFDDPRTIEAAETLVRGRVPRYVARQVVVTSLLRLHIHALGEGDTGRTGHLTDRRLVEIAWPESADAPRNLGRRERVGTLLRAALWTPPHGEPVGYMHGRCEGCAQQLSETVQGIALLRCVHEGLSEFDLWHSKILGDRRRRRERAERAGAPRARDDRESGPARTPGGAIPNPSHRTVRESPYPQQSTGAASPVKRPPSALPGFPPAKPSPLEVRHVAGLVDRVMGDLEGGSPSLRSGAAEASSLPGSGEGMGSGSLGEVRGLLLSAAPNIREQQRNGRDTTLREGSYYLFRIGSLDVSLRDRLIRDLGREPEPGRLLASAAPERFALLVRAVDAKRSTLRKPEAYIRSALSRAWSEWLGKLTDLVAQERHQDAMRARGGGL